MTIALSYLNDLARVRIDLTDIVPDGTVRVERAFLTPDPPWQVVRGGVALPIVGGVGQLDDYEYADATLNHYRVFRVDPAPGLQLTGTAGDYASTPHDVSFDIAGDITLSAVVALEDYASTNQALISKWDQVGNVRSYRLVMTNDSRIELQWTTDGTAGTIETRVSQPLELEPGQLIGLRATLDADDGAGGHVVRFWTFDPDDGTPTLISTQTFTGTTSIFTGVGILEVGASDTGTANLATGVIKSATVTADPLGTPTEVANPDFAAQADSTTNFVDAAGNTWTVNGGASILSGEVLEQDSITPDNMGATWLKSIKYPALNRAIPSPDYRPIQRAARTGIYNIKGRVPPVAVHDAWTAQYWTIETVTNTLAEARDFDLAIIGSGTYFLQVPPETENECFTNPVSGMPGGYIAIINSTQTHTVPGSHVMRWVFFIRIVAMPEPEIFGTTLTWATVERLYGSWTALWASNSTWRDVWDTIGNPEDMVVLQ